MRIAAIVAVSLCVAGSPLTAQRPRVTIVPSYSWISHTPLFEHTIVDGVGVGSRSLERLQVEDTRSFGVLATYRIADSWLIYGDVRQGESTYEYRNEVEVNGGQAGNSLTATWSSNLTIFELGFGRTLQPYASGPRIEVGLGGALHRVDIETPDVSCGGPPSTGEPPCGLDYWGGGYDVPSIVGSLSVDQHIFSRFGIRLGSSYSLGRTKTDNFWNDLTPDLDHLEAPRSYVVRAIKWFAGVSVGI